jgi:hypothetical protein
MKAQDFITSLPDGLLISRHGSTGSFDYKLDFAFNQTNPTGFDSKLKKKIYESQIWRGN